MIYRTAAKKALAAIKAAYNYAKPKALFLLGQEAALKETARQALEAAKIANDAARANAESLLLKRMVEGDEAVTKTDLIKLKVAVAKSRFKTRYAEGVIDDLEQNGFIL